MRALVLVLQRRLGASSVTRHFGDNNVILDVIPWCHTSTLADLSSQTASRNERAVVQVREIFDRSPRDTAYIQVDSENGCASLKVKYWVGGMEKVTGVQDTPNLALVLIFVYWMQGMKTHTID